MDVAATGVDGIASRHQALGRPLHLHLGRAGRREGQGEVRREFARTLHIGLEDVDDVAGWIAYVCIQDQFGCDAGGVAYLDFEFDFFAGRIHGFVRAHLVDQQSRSLCGKELQIEGGMAWLRKRHVEVATEVSRCRDEQVEASALDTINDVTAIATGGRRALLAHDDERRANKRITAVAIADEAIERAGRRDAHERDGADIIDAIGERAGGRQRLEPVCVDRQGEGPHGKSRDFKAPVVRRGHCRATDRDDGVGDWLACFAVDDAPAECRRAWWRRAGAIHGRRKTIMLSREERHGRGDRLVTGSHHLDRGLACIQSCEGISACAVGENRRCSDGKQRACQRSAGIRSDNPREIGGQGCGNELHRAELKCLAGRELYRNGERVVANLQHAQLECAGHERGQRERTVSGCRRTRARVIAPLHRGPDYRQPRGTIDHATDDACANRRRWRIGQGPQGPQCERSQVGIALPAAVRQLPSTNAISQWLQHIGRSGMRCKCQHGCRIGKHRPEPLLTIALRKQPIVR